MWRVDKLLSLASAVVTSSSWRLFTGALADLSSIDGIISIVTAWRLRIPAPLPVWPKGLQYWPRGRRGNRAIAIILLPLYILRSSNLDVRVISLHHSPSTSHVLRISGNGERPYAAKGILPPANAMALRVTDLNGTGLRNGVSTY